LVNLYRRSRVGLLEINEFEKLIAMNTEKPKTNLQRRIKACATGDAAVSWEM